MGFHHRYKVLRVCFNLILDQNVQYHYFLSIISRKNAPLNPPHLRYTSTKMLRQAVFRLSRAPRGLVASNIAHQIQLGSLRAGNRRHFSIIFNRIRSRGGVLEIVVCGSQRIFRPSLRSLSTQGPEEGKEKEGEKEGDKEKTEEEKKAEEEDEYAEYPQEVPMDVTAWSPHFVCVRVYVCVCFFRDFVQTLILLSPSCLQKIGFFRGLMFLTLAGVGLGSLYFIAKELMPSRMSPNYLFNEAFDEIKKHAQVC